MRYHHFEALRPLCPRCLHQRGVASPLQIASREEERAGDLWHGRLLCSDPACQLEFPVIDGVPLIVADPAATLATLGWQALRRDDLPAELESLIGDALGPGCDFDTTRQHLSLYSESHYRDWAGLGPTSAAATLVLQALAGAAGIPDGPALDLGSGPGRAGWEVAATTGRLTLCADLSLTFLRLAQRLRLEGRASFPRRRLGLVYDRVWMNAPDRYLQAPVDFWALDVQALPFAPATAALICLINVVDCVPAPGALLAEAARIARPSATAILATPFDWSPAATPPAAWLGGHSQRGPSAGASEPVLAAVLEQAGWRVATTRDDLDWPLRLHDRSTMLYRLHLALLQRAESLGRP